MSGPTATAGQTASTRNCSGSEESVRVIENDFVLAFDFGGTKLAVATADAAGALLLRDTVPTLPEEGAEAALVRAVRAGEGLLSATREARGGELRAVGVATMG